ncbi:glycosyltransferase [Mucilaginibacter sp.]|uniref:glycosyltransferase n=1 Tax=Mucilaginibacter sp. TaxID=1882438 RepID=UPI002ED14DD9
MANSSKIKILHITQVAGGIETYIEQIFNNIDREKFELILASPTDRQSLTKLASRYNVPHYPLALKWHISPVYDLLRIFSIIKLVKVIKPDIIHAHSSKAGMITRLAGVFFSAPILYTPNAFAYLGSNGIKKKLLILVEKMAIPFTNTLLASSKSEALRSLNDLAFSAKKVKVYPNSIEILPIEDKPSTSSSKKTITTVGRLVYQKNPMMFLNVCKILSDKRNDIMFQIIGAGFEDTLRKEIEGYIKENHLEKKINIIQWMDRPTLLKTIENTDVFVMTSAFESFGYVAAEAQMLEIPVVATDVDGLNEIVENDVTGYLIEPNNAEKMAEKIELLVDNPQQAKEMGKKGRARVSKLFDIKNNIKILEEFYIKLK